MKLRLTIVGTTLLLLASSMGVEGYHITGGTHPGSFGPLGTSHQWTAATAVPDLTDPGAILFSLAVCEQEDYPDSDFPGIKIMAPGQGGLCYMSPGYVNFYHLGTWHCFETGGRSNGFAPNYLPYSYGPYHTCQDPQILPIIAATGDWHAIQMIDSNGTPVPFIGQIDGHSCSSASLEFVYDATYAYTVDDGHVTGFATRFAGATWLNGIEVPNPLSLGTYTIQQASNPGTFCDAPHPFQQVGLPEGSSNEGPAGRTTDPSTVFNPDPKNLIDLLGRCEILINVDLCYLRDALIGECKVVVVSYCTTLNSTTGLVLEVFCMVIDLVGACENPPRPVVACPNNGSVFRIQSGRIAGVEPMEYSIACP